MKLLRRCAWGLFCGGEVSLVCLARILYECMMGCFVKYCRSRQNRSETSTLVRVVPIVKACLCVAVCLVPIKQTSSTPEGRGRRGNTAAIAIRLWRIAWKFHSFRVSDTNFAVCDGKTGVKLLRLCALLQWSRVVCASPFVSRLTTSSVIA